jgi:hypothetical protein
MKTDDYVLVNYYLDKLTIQMKMDSVVKKVSHHFFLSDTFLDN